MESWKVRASRSKANAPCRKHPKHRQSPGVCSICLGEKLSQLSNCDSSSSSSRAARSRSRSPSSSSSLSSYASSLSSSNASSRSSPAVDLRPEARSSIAFFKKSRSMAFVPRRRREEADQINEKEIRLLKRGFWSKLLPKKGRKMLMHSRTTREIKGSLHHFIIS